MKLPSLFKTHARPWSSSWSWPSCNHPKTLSFRADVINSSSDSWFSTSSESESASFSTEGDITETVIRGVKSERLFFEAEATNSIVEAAPLKGSLVISVESRDPYGDFRESMEEMVEAHGLREWDHLEELLACYLRVNCTHNHHYILAAFIDLLLPLLISTPHQQQQQ